MIGYIRGQVQNRWEGGVVVDVNGIGHEIQMPASSIAKLPPSGQEVTVFTHLAWREDAISLYGFDRLETRDMFRLLLEVSGVGPRLALNVLSAFAAEELLQVLARGDTEKLQAIHGVGRKTAARLCVDLRERAKRLLSDKTKETAEVLPVERDGSNSLWNDALSALLYLGYRPAEAKSALAEALSSVGEEARVEDVIKTALSGLAKIRRTEP
jgi:Holliday junction DNA helicase RuvA